MDTVVPPPSSAGISHHPPDPTSVPSPDAIREELEKIFASNAFRNAEGQRAFLRYVVEQSLKGLGDQIKEYTIGIEVFHRKDSFDPRRDNTVRVKAQKLRWSLSKYYEDEGKNDAVRIEFPTGAYKPGFRYAAALTQNAANAQSAEATPAETENVVRAPASNAFDWRIAASIVVALLLLAGIFFTLRYRAHRATPPPPAPSIAVLPFRILNNEKEEEFFSDGLIEDLTDSLAQMPGLRVVAASSAFEYKGKAVDVREIGRKLSVGVVLEGSVRRFQNRVRVTAELSDTATGFHIWSASYDREMKDVLQIQREISDSITSALGVKLAGSQNAEGGQTAAAPNSEAYEEYLKGRYFFARGTQKDFETAIMYFQEAIAKDPSYAPSYVGLAHCYSALPSFSNTTSDDTVPKIRENALKALSLDGKLGEAHVDLALAYSYDYQWSMAEEEYKKALELSPGVAVVHQRYSSFLIKMGRFQDALDESEKALSLDPVSPLANRTPARVLYFMGRYDEALKQYKEALELDPDSATTHEYIGLAYFEKGMRAKGISEIQIAHDSLKSNVWYSGLLGWAEALDGRTAAAREILQDLLQRSAHDDSPAIAIAHVYIGLGDKEQAFVWLRKAIDSRNANVWLLKIDPIYTPLRNDPRFKDLLARMNIS